VGGSFAHRRCYARRRQETEIENCRCGSFTRCVFVIARYHEVLRQLGLDTMEGVKSFTGELIKDHKGRRDIQRAASLPPAASSGMQRLVFYVKRNWRPYKKDGFKSLFRRGEVWSQSRVEWENSLALQRAGFAVAEPVAFGDECGLLWERFSFLITAQARGETTVDEFLRTNTNGTERRRIFEALAREVRKMHDAGLASPDLFTRHIFIEHGSGPKFCLIDMARMDRRKRVPAALRARDLAALHVTAPLRFMSTQERLGFLKAYGGDMDLKKRIEKRTRHLLQRRKFEDFSRS
jgi:tRNA A-37 threonylcarbamoyl transferase component Bud32